MATEAQIAANRLNAQKSTGPRTAEGKAVVAQNAVKHGLLAREAVLRGEDGEEFERHREALLEQLNPAGPLEAILAARIVDLTWRLQRAAQDRNETFGALYDRHTAGTPEPGNAALLSGNDKKANPEIGGPGAILGRMILEDYSGEAVLERLLRCERRIEGSLFRNLNELRRVHDQGRKADLETADTLARWREEDGQSRKERAFAPWRPADRPSGPDSPTTNTPRFAVPHECDMSSSAYSRPTEDAPPAEKTCETNPISGGAGESQVIGATEVRLGGVRDRPGKTNPIPGDTHGRDGRVTHGQDAHATELTDPGGTDTPVGQSCQTNPICSEPDVSQVQCGTTLMSDTAADGLQKTNPICAVLRGTGIPSASLSGQALPVASNHGQDAHATHGRDGRATHGQDGHATEPPGGIPTIRVEAQGQLCETKPIGTGVAAIQVLCSTEVTADLGGRWSCENKANFPVLRQGQPHRAGQPAVAKADAAKQSQFAERTAWAKAHPTRSRLEFGQSRETNPIPGWDGTGRGPRDGG